MGEPVAALQCTISLKHPTLYTIPEALTGITFNCRFTKTDYFLF